MRYTLCRQSERQRGVTYNVYVILLCAQDNIRNHSLYCTLSRAHSLHTPGSPAASVTSDPSCSVHSRLHPTGPTALPGRQHSLGSRGRATAEHVLFVASSVEHRDASPSRSCAHAVRVRVLLSGVLAQQREPALARVVGE